MIGLELVYINNDVRDFICGNKYRVVSFVNSPWEIFGVDNGFGSISEFTGWDIWNYFITLDDYRNHKLESIGI
jgi:hypothetical protein